PVFPGDLFCPPLPEGLHGNPEAAGHVLDRKVVRKDGRPELSGKGEDITIGTGDHRKVPGLLCGSPDPGELVSTRQTNPEPGSYEQVVTAPAFEIHEFRDHGWCRIALAGDRVIRKKDCGIENALHGHLNLCRSLPRACGQPLRAVTIQSAAESLLHPLSMVSLQKTSRIPLAFRWPYAPPISTPWTQAA